MPSQGLQIFGSGMHLQPVTPGVADIGNAHISGRLVSDKGAFPTAQPEGWWIGNPESYKNISIGTEQSFSWGFYESNISGGVFIGNGISVSTNPNGNNTPGAVTIGQDTVNKDPGNTVLIGYMSRNGSSAQYPGANSANVVIGAYAESYTWAGSTQPGDTIVGSGSKSGAGPTVPGPTNRNTLLGSGHKAQTAGTGKNCLVGAGITAKTNCIVILQSANGVGYTEPNDNVIKIGDSTHTRVNVGPLSLYPPPTITGSRGGNAALASLLTSLAAANLIVDGTTA